MHWIAPTLSGKCPYVITTSGHARILLTVSHRVVHWLRTACHISTISELFGRRISHVVSIDSPVLKPNELSLIDYSAASAIAANTFLRSIAGAVFPLFSMYMFDALKVNWTGTLLGCVAALLVPIPIVFYKFGHKIRQRSKFAPILPKPQASGEISSED